MAYNPFNFSSYDTTPMAPTDPYAGASYTGTQTYQPPLSDPYDYWNEETSGYDQMPKYSSDGYKPYDVASLYQPAELGQDALDLWGNANTYAPWSGYSPGGNEATPWELAQQPGYSAEGGRNSVGYNPFGVGGASGALLGAGGGSLALGPIGAIPAVAMGGIGGLFGMKKKKRPDYQFEAPSYQGYMFTPEEGFPEYYRPSQESINQTQQDIYQQGYTTPSTTETYDYNYTGGVPQTGQQNYVGQQDQAYGSFYNDPSRNSLYQTFKPGEYSG